MPGILVRAHLDDLWMQHLASRRDLPDAFRVPGKHKISTIGREREPAAVNPQKRDAGRIVGDMEVDDNALDGPRAREEAADGEVVCVDFSPVVGNIRSHLVRDNS